MAIHYQEWLERRARNNQRTGFEPSWVPDCLFDFQKFGVGWACQQGRCALFEACGLGKTPQQLVWAENVVRLTNRPVLLATPIAVGAQTIREAEKFGVTAKRTRDGKITDEPLVWVTNYEQVHKYDPSKFAAFVGDESSATKSSGSNRREIVTDFCRKMPYRLLCTATPAPNDYDELGTSSEILGGLGYRDMVTTFFRQETKKDHRGWGRTKLRFRGHAEDPFWSWVCSWARAISKPSDVGGDDTPFILPPLNEIEHVAELKKARPGMLFPVAAKDMREERAERRHSMDERCELAASIANAVDGPCAVWCELNDEADAVERAINGAVQVSGSDSDDSKEEKLTAFSLGQIQRIVLKPAIGAWGLNWQHCSEAVVFPSHSYERYHQLISRFHRFGQTKPVNIHTVVCEGELGIVKNIARKREQANRMFESLVEHMNNPLHLLSDDNFFQKESIPSWL